MATPYHILVPSNETGLLRWKQSNEAAVKVSELLQKDLETHHALFSPQGFHNHIAHQLLSLYGTGATPGVLETAFAANTSYQIKVGEPHVSIVEDLKRGWAKDSPYLDKGKHYTDFLKFFQDEIEGRGWQEVLQEYVFKGDERSEDLLSRLFAGLLHPLIQVMYGIEWQQPALIASGLAQAAIHENRMGPMLAKVDEITRSRTLSPSPQHLTIPELFETIRQNRATLATSARWEDGARIYQNILDRAGDEALDLLAQVRVREDELEERLAEMIHSCAYVAAATVFHPPNVPKFDFFLIHHLTSTPFFVTLFKFPWLSASAKARILERKIRLDLIQYIARGCPSLNLASIRSFTPSNTDSSITKPEGLIPRFHNIVDDGHTIKVVRALLLTQKLSLNYVDKPWIRISDDETWLKVHYLLLEGTEGQKSNLWVRGAGFDEAWNEMPEAK